LKVTDGLLNKGLKQIDSEEEIVLDTCGTGGKPTKTFNISTCVAFVVACAGIKVAKHGNRSFSGVCGSADVLEALGIDLNVEPKIVEKAVKKIGIGFLYAPLYHPAMRNVASVRKEIGIRTIFNIVGPLTNPARASHQVLGVYEKNLTEKIAHVLRNLGTKRAFVVWGKDVYDEVSITGQTKITELKNKRIKTFYVRPKDFGLKLSKLTQIRGGGVKENVLSFLSVLKGEPSAKLDAVLINASVCFVLTNKADNFKEGIDLARNHIVSGKALKKLQELKEFLREHG
jgi:anthranilate phosphoribosyltransferase